MKSLIVGAAVGVVFAGFAIADGISVHPAQKTPAQMVAEPAPVARPSWEPRPDELPAKYLSIVQDRLGHCYTSEAEARAMVDVQSAEIERMKKVISDLQQELEKHK